MPLPHLKNRFLTPWNPYFTPSQLGLFCCSGWAHMCPDIQS